MFEVVSHFRGELHKTHNLYTESVMAAQGHGYWQVEMCGNGFQYSQSLPFPQGPSHAHSRNLHIWNTIPIPVLLPLDNSFPFPPIPIPASTFRLIVGLPKTKWAKQHTYPH